MTAGPPLDLPERASKPREVGITALMDRGLSLAEVDGLMEVAGSAVDIVKLGFGTAAATENLEAKLDRWRDLSPQQREKVRERLRQRHRESRTRIR